MGYLLVIVDELLLVRKELGSSKVRSIVGLAY
jgi:hypothetical protein